MPREFTSQKAIRNHAELTGYVYLWEGTHAGPLLHPTEGVGRHGTMKPGGRGLNDSAIATASDPPLVDMRAPVGPDVGANHAAARAHHPRAERRTTVSSDTNRR